MASTAAAAVVSARPTPVFVVGHGRSGTTILVQLIAKFLGVSFGSESQFIIRYLRRLPRYGPLAAAGAMERLLDDVAQERYFVRTGRNFGFRLDKARALREAGSPTYAALLDAIFRQFAEHQGTTRWGDKTPEYSLHLPEIHRLFPNAQYVHVVRDGRDVTLSTFKTHFGAKNAYAGAVEWSEAVQAIRAFRDTVPAGQFFEMRYEDLLASPVRVFSALVGFLGVEDPLGAVRERIEKEIGADLKADNAYKWRTQWSSSEVARFESVAGAMLADYGYERRFPDAAPPGWGARLVWSADNRLRKYRMPAYWRDNWYKLRLRARALDVRR